MPHAYLYKANVSLPFHNSGNHPLVLCENVLLGWFDIRNLDKRSAQRHNDFLNALHAAQGCWKMLMCDKREWARLTGQCGRVVLRQRGGFAEPEDSRDSNVREQGWWLTPDALQIKARLRWFGPAHRGDSGWMVRGLELVGRRFWRKSEEQIYGCSDRRCEVCCWERGEDGGRWLAVATLSRSRQKSSIWKQL